MINSFQDEHEGWRIYTFADEIEPRDFGGRRPTEYSFHGYAEFSNPNVYPAGFKSKDRINLPKDQAHVSSNRDQGHCDVQKKLKDEIDSKKVES